MRFKQLMKHKCKSYAIHMQIVYILHTQVTGRLCKAYHAAYAEYMQNVCNL